MVTALAFTPRAFHSTWLVQKLGSAGQLRQFIADAQKAKKDGDDDRLRMVTSYAYGRLRLAWERCVEEVLLNGVVQRFGEGVSTQRLKAVLVTDDDYKQIEAGMTKSSKFEHDAASLVG
jgi:hypothetical protein